MSKTHKTWNMEGANPISDIKRAKEIIKNTSYIPSRCFCCNEILPDHFDHCRICRVLQLLAEGDSNDD